MLPMQLLQAYYRSLRPLAPFVPGRRAWVRAGMSVEQTIFYHTFAAYEHLQQYKVNSLSRHRRAVQRHLQAQQRLVGALRTRTVLANCLRLDAASDRLLSLLEQSTELALAAVSRQTQLPGVRDLLQALARYCYTLLPGLDRVLDTVRARKVRAYSRTALRQVEQRLQALQSTNGRATGRTRRRGRCRQGTWRTMLDTVAGITLGFVAVGLISAGPVLVVYLLVQDLARDLLVIGWFSAMLAGAISLAGRFTPQKRRDG